MVPGSVDLHRSGRCRIHHPWFSLADSLLFRFLLLAMYVAHPSDVQGQLAHAIDLVDVIISCAWFAAFGILVDTIHKSSCGSTWDWGGITHGDSCGRWKAAEAFSFISACVWMVSGIVVCSSPSAHPPIYLSTYLSAEIYLHSSGNLVYFPLPSFQWSPLRRLNRSLDRSTSATVLASPYCKTIRNHPKPHAH